MRSALAISLIFACFSTSAYAQSGSYLATITESKASLYVGPGDQYPVTETLKQGDQVLVDHEEANGWLAVQAPPGKIISLSWVSIQFVSGFDNTKPTPQNVMTVGEAGDVIALAPGQMGSAEPLAYYRMTKVPVGTILTVIGPKKLSQGRSWYPVAPPSGDFRFIAKQVVKSEKPVNTSFTIKENTTTIPPASIPATSPNLPTQPATTNSIIGSPVGVGTATTQVPASIATTTNVPASIASTPTAPVPVVNNPLWTQAEAAEQAGRLDDAEKLYFQLARQMNEPGGDHDIANLCYTRIHGLREKKRANPSNSVIAAPRPVLGSPQQSKGLTVSTTDNTPNMDPGSQKPGYIATGKLTRSALDYEGKMTYALQGSPGETSFYVVAGPGVDLGRYLNKRVDVYGTSDSTKRGLSKPYVVATGAELVQQ